jgi:hypothetical protein
MVRICAVSFHDVFINSWPPIIFIRGNFAQLFSWLQFLFDVLLFILILGFWLLIV